MAVTIDRAESRFDRCADLIAFSVDAYLGLLVTWRSIRSPIRRPTKLPRPTYGRNRMAGIATGKFVCTARSQG
jgi:hypothetical protein